MTPAPRPARLPAILFLLLTAIAVAVALLHDPVRQDPDYHRFVDLRTLLGIPRAADVLSNAAFLLVGAWGLWTVRTATFADPRERLPWGVLFAGVALTSAGSAYYHLRPDSARLVWDRLPMTLGFMGLFAALVGERVSLRWGLRLLGPLVAVGVGTVAYWAWVDNLVPYLVVQFYPLVAIPLLLVLFPARYTRGEDLLLALAWYLAAKVAEGYDREVFAFTGIASGHTLKHLLAAAGAGWMARMLALRRPERGASPAGAAAPAPSPQA